MTENDISMHIISGIIDAGKRIVGEGAIKAANEVEGLKVNANGEIVVTGEFNKIIGELCRTYEKALQGRLVVDVEVRLNLKRGGGV